MIVLLALVAFVVTSRFENILDMALYAYTMVGAAVTPALLAAFLWKRVTPMGGMVSIASGIVATMVFAGLAQAGVGSLNLGLFELPLEYDYIIYPAAVSPPFLVAHRRQSVDSSIGGGKMAPLLHQRGRD